MFRSIMSVTDKTGLVELAQGLQRRFGADQMIISTGGTYKILSDAKVEVTKIESITGVPEMMDGRVKTINPKIAGAILARRDIPVHMQDLRELLKFDVIDLVVVNLYPFSQTAANPEKSFTELVENIDIGGPTLIRAAAKNFRFVYVLTSPDQYATMLKMLDATPEEQLEFRYELMKEAFRHTADYDTAIAVEMEDFTDFEGGIPVRSPAAEREAGF